jgi:hypothetical protein
MADEDSTEVRQTPVTNEGSGRFSVFDHDLGQYVSGVMSKADATSAAKDMAKDKDATTNGHKLEAVEV